MILALTESGVDDERWIAQSVARVTVRQVQGFYSASGGWHTVLFRVPEED